MKWIVLIVGPNHQAKDLDVLLTEEYKNLNIVIVLITHNRQTHRMEVMNSGSQLPALQYSMSGVGGLQGAKFQQHNPFGGKMTSQSNVQDGDKILGKLRGSKDLSNKKNSKNQAVVNPNEADNYAQYLN